MSGQIWRWIFSWYVCGLLNFSLKIGSLALNFTGCNVSVTFLLKTPQGSLTRAVPGVVVLVDGTFLRGLEMESTSNIGSSTYSSTSLFLRNSSVRITTFLTDVTGGTCGVITPICTSGTAALKVVFTGSGASETAFSAVPAVSFPSHSFSSPLL